MSEYPKPPYTDSQLRYAAYARCQCGAGLAYAPNANPRADAWFCSALLKDASAKSSEHDPGKPFAFWEVKSEIQPSANGATTRPKDAETEAVIERPRKPSYEELEVENAQLREALIWCSGSQDFAPGGVAREGWEKGCAPLLAGR